MIYGNFQTVFPALFSLGYAEAKTLEPVFFLYNPVCHQILDGSNFKIYPKSGSLLCPPLLLPVPKPLSSQLDRCCRFLIGLLAHTLASIGSLKDFSVFRPFNPIHILFIIKCKSFLWCTGSFMIWFFTTSLVPSSTFSPFYLLSLFYHIGFLAILWTD